jgi:hypothetical protein
MVRNVIKDLDRLLKSLYVKNSFIALGIILSILGVFSNHEVALRVGLLTTFFGGIFRLWAIVADRIPIGKRINSHKTLFLAIIKLTLWLSIFGIYGHYLNKIITIF